jgi:DNA-binding NarL/FixJ family response regulator
MKTINILFAEDHEMVRNGIKLMLNSQNSFVAQIDEAKDGQEAIQMALEKRYDVILLDINLPIRNGIEVAKFLNSKLGEIRILALSSHNEDFVIKQMIDAGALGYILKNSGLEELTKAILTVFNFKKYYSNDVAQTLINKSTQDEKEFNQELTSIPLNHNLSNREIEILKHIAEGSTSIEIGEQLNISPRTVGNHRNNLLQKLQVKNSVGLARYAIKNGLA